MSTIAPPPSPLMRRQPTRIDQWVLGIHIAAAAAFGVFGFLSSTDPEFGGLQRVLVLMIAGVWALGILVMWLIARRVESQAARVAILIAGPIVAVIAFFARGLVI